MTKIRQIRVVIRNWNLDIVWDLVLGDWCFARQLTFCCYFAHNLISKRLIRRD